MADKGSGTHVCRKCDGPKEPSRLRSSLCRKCDGAGSKKKGSTVSHALRLDLPADVWARLDAEAKAHDQYIGAYVRGLIVARDERKQNKASARADRFTAEVSDQK